MVSTPPPWRAVVIEQLETLASENEQLQYERNVSHVDITAELVCGWFDDSYHPGDIRFRSCFTDEELAALAEFNAVFKSCIPRLPKRTGTVRTWLASASWREVMDAAATALDRMSGRGAR